MKLNRRFPAPIAGAAPLTQGGDPPRRAASALSKRRRAHPEADFQHTLVAWLEIALPEDAWFTAIDHSRRGIRDGARLKRMGVKKGIPDILIFWHEKCLWIECKADRGYASDDQAEFMARARQAGHQAWIARTLEDAWHLLKDAGIPRRARPT